MLFRVLGPLEVEVEGAPVPVRGARPRALLTALLLEPNTVVPAHRLVEALWPRRTPDNPTNALHQVVARLRAQLGPAGDVLVTRPPGYVLRVDPSAVDAACFAAEYRTARHVRPADPARAAELLDAALARWRGPAYGELADGFALAAATGLEELRTAALEDRAELLLDTGFPAAAVAAARDLLARQPLRERPVALLMRALHADGRAGEALAAYREHRDLVADELGLDPAAGLRELEARILRDDLGAPRRPAPPVPPSGPDLPWRPGPLLGRDRELDLLLVCLPTQRLVTLVGPGGVGKTRLALEAAHELAGTGDAVWWVDLAPVTAARTVDALAAATGAELPRTTDPASSLCRALRPARGVLCLDNAEHLLAELAPLVERLAATAPDLAVLATSRERLAVGCEHVHPLSPLPAAADRENPAVRLFIERAPGLEAAALSDDDVAAVAEVCRRLDGLPLAIELGAARAAAFGVRELAARLGDRLDLLAGGRRTAAARHRTLRAVVDWSHELLSPEEARLFGRLAVFPSAFTLDQAEEVCADEHIPRSAVPTLLARLVEQSLVQAGQGRLWLLETLRAYAAERVDDEPALPARHARFTAQRLAAQRPRLSTAEEPAAVAALVAMDADLHAAWTWAVEHDRALAVQLAGDVYDYAYHRQRRDLLAWGLAVGDWHPAHPSDHPRLPDAAAAAAAAAWSAGRLDAAAELAERGVRAAGGTPRCGRALIQLSNMAMFDGRTDEAVAGFRRAAALHRAADEAVRALLCEISVAHAFNSGGRNGEAAALVGELLARARASGNPTAVCWALHVTGDAVAPLDADRAAADYAAAIEQASAVDNRLFLLLARASSVTLAARHGDPTRWLVEFDRAIEQCTDVGNEAMLLWWLLPLAGLLARVGAVHEAAVLAGGVRAARARRPRLPRDEARLAETLAHLRARLGARATDDAVAKGAAMPLADLVASARRAIRAARG